MPELPLAVWHWLCEVAPVRPDVVTAMRCKLDAGTLPSALDLADAMLGFRRVA